MSMEFFFENYYHFYNSRDWRTDPSRFYADDITLVVDPLKNVVIGESKNVVEAFNMTLEYVDDKVEFEKARIFGDGNSFAVEVPMTYQMRKMPQDQVMRDKLAEIGLISGMPKCRVQYFMHYDLNRSGQFSRIAVAVSGRSAI
jgi:hypothetical protein